MFHYFYIGQLKDGGDLEKLTGVVETQLKGSNIRVIQITKEDSPEVVLQKAAAFWTVISTLQPGYRENAVKAISESGKTPTAILCFDSPLPPETFILPTPHGIERDEMLGFFAEEADFIGFLQREYLSPSQKIA